MASAAALRRSRVFTSSPGSHRLAWKVTATVTSTGSLSWSNLLGGLCMSSRISAILSNTSAFVLHGNSFHNAFRLSCTSHGFSFSGRKIMPIKPTLDFSGMGFMWLLR